MTSYPLPFSPASATSPPSPLHRGSSGITTKHERSPDSQLDGSSASSQSSINRNAGGSPGVCGGRGVSQSPQDYRGIPSIPRLSSMTGGYYPTDVHDMINLYLPPAGSGNGGSDIRELQQQHCHQQGYLHHPQQSWMMSPDTARLMQHPLYASAAADLTVDGDYGNMASRLSTAGAHGYQLTHSRLF